MLVKDLIQTLLKAPQDAPVLSAPYWEMTPSATDVERVIVTDNGRIVICASENTVIHEDDDFARLL